MFKHVKDFGLDVTPRKLKNEEEISAELLQAFAFPGDLDDDQMLLPVDVSVLDQHFPSDTYSVDEHVQLNVDFLISKLGPTEAGKALVQAQQAYLDNQAGNPELGAKPMTVAEWRELFYGLEGMEEELAEDDEEVEWDAEQPGDDQVSEPASKKAKTD